MHTRVDELKFGNNSILIRLITKAFYLIDRPDYTYDVNHVIVCFMEANNKHMQGYGLPYNT